MLSDRAVTVLVKLLAAGLLAVTAVGTVVLLGEGGLRAAIPGFLGLYMSLVLAAGVFADSFFEPRIQIAFAVGLVPWGGYVSATQSGAFGVLLAAAGVFWAIEQVRELT